MEKLTVLLAMAMSVSALKLKADQITFSFVALNPSSIVTASDAGLQMGPAENVLVTDVTTHQQFTLAGNVNGSTGSASSFTVLSSPSIVLAGFNAGGADSVSIVERGVPILTGVMGDMSTLISSYPKGTGAFLSPFTVTSVDPGVLSLFDLTTVLPDGSVSVTFGAGNVIGPDQFSAILGGGTITIQAPTVDGTSVGLLLSAGLMVIFVAKRFRTL